MSLAACCREASTNFWAAHSQEGDGHVTIVDTQTALGGCLLIVVVVENLVGLLPEIQRP